MVDKEKEQSPVGRLAPSPTGVLHLGNARSFLLAWLQIRSQGGKLLLRIEDIDSPRVVPAAEQGVVEDLQWLGLDWDGPITRQSERLALYRAAAEGLRSRGLAYLCTCTRKDIERAASAPHENPHEGLLYPGTCRERHLDPRDCPAPWALRFCSSRETLPFVDGFCGPQEGFVGGDFVIQKKDGGPAYQLAVVVDDAAQGVTDVLRADDLLPSTPRQLLLYEALDLTPPSFHHVPLVVGPDGLRLAKRHGDTSLATFRRQGISAESVVGLLATSLGLNPRGRPCRPGDLLESFSLKAVPREPFIFKDEMLRPG